jgi:hypothetical protein
MREKKGASGIWTQTLPGGSSPAFPLHHPWRCERAFSFYIDIPGDVSTISLAYGILTDCLKQRRNNNNNNTKNNNQINKQCNVVWWREKRAWDRCDVIGRYVVNDWVIEVWVNPTRAAENTYIFLVSWFFGRFEPNCWRQWIVEGKV